MNDFDILELAKKLRFTGISDTLMARVEQARSASLSYEELLAMLSSFPAKIVPMFHVTH